MNEIKTSTLIVIAVVLAIIAAILLQISTVAKGQRVQMINSFAECAQAGYPIMESYPEQCRTPDGRLFVNTSAQQPVQQAPVQGQKPDNLYPGDGLGLQANGCAVAGCSGQLCVEAREAGSIVTTCEYRAEYACYQSQSRCERQSTGMCDWTPTEELRACLKDPLETKLDASLQVI